MASRANRVSDGNDSTNSVANVLTASQPASSKLAELSSTSTMSRRSSEAVSSLMHTIPTGPRVVLLVVVCIGEETDLSGEEVERVEGPGVPHRKRSKSLHTSSLNSWNGVGECSTPLGPKRSSVPLDTRSPMPTATRSAPTACSSATRRATSSMNALGSPSVTVITTGRTDGRRPDVSDCSSSSRTNRSALSVAVAPFWKGRASMASERLYRSPR